jgi:pilus assembly protein CpaC
MRMTSRGSAGALLLAVCGMAIAATAAQSNDRPRGGEQLTIQQSVLTIPARANFPLEKKVDLGKGKSLLVQFPFELKDVLVADPETLDVVVQASNRVFLIGKKVGSSNAFFFDSKGQQILTLEVQIGADLGSLESLLARLVPGSNIHTELAGGAIVLSGQVRTPLDSNRAGDIAFQFALANKNQLAKSAGVAAAAGGQPSAESQTTVTLGPGQNTGTGGSTKKDLIINLLAVDGEEQVMLKVTVAEVQRTLLKQFGVNLGAVTTSGNFVTSVLSQNALPLTAAAGLPPMVLPYIPNGTSTPALFSPLTQSPGFQNSGVTTGYHGGGTTMTGVLQALERDGLVRTLAEPNLTAVSGETAKFLAGGEFPIPVVDTNGKLTVMFKEFGISVAFTPVVLSEGRISLKIDSEVSELTDVGAVVLSSISIPALNKRQARTTVELPSGGSLAIAGLISDQTRQNIDGFPGLKDLPVLGTLFRSRDYSKAETELVVIVTPYMVAPTARRNLARADDGFAPASDLKADFLGHLNRIYGQGRGLPPGDLKGDHGFIVE